MAEDYNKENAHYDEDEEEDDAKYETRVRQMVHAPRIISHAGAKHSESPL